MNKKYQEILNKIIMDTQSSDFISELQSDLTKSAKLCNSDIYDLTKEITNQTVLNQNIDINLLLKCYLVNQVLSLRDTVEDVQENNSVFEDTSNPKIKREINSNKYYFYENDLYKFSSEIEAVYSDGSYVKLKSVKNSTYKIRETLTFDDNIMSFQLIDPNGEIVKQKWQVVEFLGMRKEFSKKYKYSGYSGNSKDFVASFLNQISSPIETGYFMDKNCNLYKWDNKNYSFKLYKNLATQSPLLTDYEFNAAGIVIRKEYTGI